MGENQKNPRNDNFQIADGLEALLGINTQSEDKEQANKRFRTCPLPLNNIKISKRAMEKIFLMASSVAEIYETPLEVYALCIGENGIITDILIPSQSVSYVSIHIKPESILELTPYIRENQLNIIGWAHSHANFGVFFSSTDDRNQITLLSETSNFTIEEEMRIKYAFGMTVNTHRDSYGIISTQFPCGKISQEISQITIIDPESHIADIFELKARIKKEVEQKVHFGSGFRNRSRRKKKDRWKNHRKHREFDDLADDIFEDQKESDYYRNSFDDYEDRYIPEFMQKPEIIKPQKISLEDNLKQSEDIEKEKLVQKSKNYAKNIKIIDSYIAKYKIKQDEKYRLRQRLIDFMRLTEK
jgi:proteasome lid subunit RPN8/RPN11